MQSVYGLMFKERWHEHRPTGIQHGKTGTPSPSAICEQEGVEASQEPATNA